MIKRILKLLISGVVGLFDSIKSVVLCRLLARPMRPVCVVIYYHDIPVESQHKFFQQLDIMERLSNPIPLHFCGKLEFGKRYFAISFDDGLADVLLYALPELARRQIPATVFIPTGHIGQSASWASNSEYSRKKILTQEQMLAVGTYDLVSIGSHCITHRPLRALDDTEAKHEIVNSKRQLERILGQKIDLLAFPYGQFKDHHIRYAKDAGYLRVFTTRPSLAFAVSDEYSVGRVGVEPLDWPVELRLKLMGSYRWCSSFSHRKAKLKAVLARVTAF